jgi:hypothetical protein
MKIGLDQRAQQRLAFQPAVSPGQHRCAPFDIVFCHVHLAPRAKKYRHSFGSEAGRTDPALAAFLKRPQAEAQIGAVISI